MGTVLKNKVVTTRKTHQCFSCFRKFPEGSKMHYYAGIYEGGFSSVYACSTCVEIMRMHTEDGYPEGYVSEMLNTRQTPEELLEEIREMVRVEKSAK